MAKVLPCLLPVVLPGGPVEVAFQVVAHDNEAGLCVPVLHTVQGMISPCPVPALLWLKLLEQHSSHSSHSSTAAQQHSSTAAQQHSSTAAQQPLQLDAVHAGADRLRWMQTRMVSWSTLGLATQPLIMLSDVPDDSSGCLY